MSNVIKLVGPPLEIGMFNRILTKVKAMVISPSSSILSQVPIRKKRKHRSKWGGNKQLWHGINDRKLLKNHCWRTKWGQKNHMLSRNDISIGNEKFCEIIRELSEVFKFNSFKHFLKDSFKPIKSTWPAMCIKTYFTTKTYLTGKIIRLIWIVQPLWWDKLTNKKEISQPTMGWNFIFVNQNFIFVNQFWPIKIIKIAKHSQYDKHSASP